MAVVKILVKGYTSADAKSEESQEERTCATISLITDENIKMVVDPGLLKSKDILINALKKENLNPEDINYVALTHSHADHFRNIGLFPNARLLEYFGIWHEDTVEDWKEDFSKNIKIIKTPGHSNTGISFVVNTNKGKIAIVGDVFWKENEPVEDSYADNIKQLKESRKKMLKIADYIIPGHG
ncbi:MBL fold metallo-hydrolase [Candidatus Pacearchaeota archaeon]|nr:MBL fold metallo-hydrolase [Candidatus Pacearchaeota archaeon]